MAKVYLAGPITGLSYGEAALGWRQYVHEKMTAEAPHIQCYSPMRGKQFLIKHGDKPLPGTPDNAGTRSPISTDRAVITRDRYDVQSADALFINFLGAKIVSIGTVWEIGQADAFRKPMIVCMEPGNLHEHIFINGTAGYVVDNIDEGLGILKHLFTHGV